MIARASVLLACCAAWLSGCASPAPNQVVVLGMIHSGHTTSSRYSIAQLREIIRRIDPDDILCEIPPDRFPIAQREFRTTGTISEPRVKRFPEYTDAVFPLQRELGFTIVPCAAWTREMADDRREKLTLWQDTRPEDTAEVENAQAELERILTAEHAADDPWLIHTERYDELVRTGMEPYERLFGDDLGPGGWEAINRAHYARIDRALRDIGPRGHRVLITFGAWHKYWILDQLRERDDITLLDARCFIPPPSD